MRSTDQWATTCSRPARPMAAARSRSPSSSSTRPAMLVRVARRRPGSRSARPARSRSPSRRAWPPPASRWPSPPDRQIGLASCARSTAARPSATAPRARRSRCPGSGRPRRCPVRGQRFEPASARGPSPTTRNRAAGSCRWTSAATWRNSSWFFSGRSAATMPTTGAAGVQAQLLPQRPVRPARDGTAPRRRRWESRGPSRPGSLRARPGSGRAARPRR